MKNIKKRKKVSFTNLIFSSKILLLFLFFLSLFFFSGTAGIKRFIPGKGNFERPISIEEVVVNVPPPTPFAWTVEKADDQITKIALPPDPAMSTPDELFDAMKGYQQGLNQLKVLLGKENEAEFELTDSLQYQFFGYPSLREEINKDIVVNFYSSRSNFLRITEIQVEQSKSFLSLANKNSYPDFNFGLAFQNRQSIPANLPDGKAGGFDQYFGLNVGVSLPMFYSSGVSGDIQEAEANLSISDSRSQYAKIRVAQNVRTAYNNLSFAEEQLRLFDNSLLRDVEDELRAGITAYQNGQIDLLNLFDIYRTYRATRVEYSRTVYNTLVALTELEVAGEEIVE